MPDTFVKPTEELDFNESFQEGKAAKLLELGIAPNSSIIVLGVKAIFSAILFIAEKSAAYSQRHLEILQMLKEPFVIALHNAIRFYELERIKNRLVEDNQALQNDMQREVGDRVIGMHQGLKQVMSLVNQVAYTSSPVLLLGETGCGKEVIATAIHRISDRNQSPFISVNCGAIPESIIDSELFGHERGAFTGANERKRGRFERADKGTLFLDEVGELPPSAQVKLLRVLQEKEFERVGGSSTIRVDVRLIAATNRNLRAMVRQGQFREDLWYRLNVFPIEIPPLRERREDIPALVLHFIETKYRQFNLPFRPRLPPEELERLMAYDWPGNVRELQNAIERALILSRGEPLRFPNHSLQQNNESVTIMPQSHPAQWLTYDQTVANYLRSVLIKTQGKIAGPHGAAKITGLNPSTLRSKLKKLGIRMPHD